MSEIRNTVRELLEAHTLLVLQGVELEQHQREALLHRYRAELDATLAHLLAVVDHARTDGIETMHLKLHDAPGVDHEMLDQAAAWAADDEREDGPALEIE